MILPTLQVLQVQVFLLRQDRASVYIAAYHDISIQVAVVVCRAGLQDCSVRLVHGGNWWFLFIKTTLKETAYIQCRFSWLGYLFMCLELYEQIQFEFFSC